MVYGPHHKIKLSAETIESVCLSCSHEFYDNASSGNYKFGDMKLAYDWYAYFLKEVLRYRNLINP